jgi:putative PLP-dependent aminotransferase (TIGR04422 family)
MAESVRVFPYASQCVVNAAFAAGKSICTPKQNRDRDIFYHQWGYHELGREFSNFLIEDSADSFYPVGGSVCKNGSRFEVWSLPKIIGASNGGIVWCKNNADAIALKSFMDKLKPQNYFIETILYVLKSKSLSTYRAWEKYQFSNPKLNSMDLRSLNYLISKWQILYNKRLELYIKHMSIYKKVGELEVIHSVKQNCGVIPVVIKVPDKHKSNSIELHELLKDGESKTISVVPYQRNIKP